MANNYICATATLSLDDQTSALKIENGPSTSTKRSNTLSFFFESANRDWYSSTSDWRVSARARSVFHMFDAYAISLVLLSRRICIRFTLRDASFLKFSSSLPCASYQSTTWTQRKWAHKRCTRAYAIRMSRHKKDLIMLNIHAGSNHAPSLENLTERPK